MQPSFRVKVCGITSPEQALMVAAAGADAVGLNFVPASRRFLDDAAACAVAEAVPAGVLRVGLFVDSPRATIERLAQVCQLDVIQLHGDEPAQLLADLPPIPILRAFRIPSAADDPHQHRLAEILAYLSRCSHLGRSPDAVLMDAYAPDAHGGTGIAGNWPAAASFRQLGLPPSLVLAGGLNAGNVAAAIRQVQPAAVDVSSGVESSPGVKDPVLVRAFVQAALAAFGSSHGR